MKVKLINKTDFSQYVDLDGDADNHDTTVIVGPKATVVVDIDSEAQFINIASTHKSTLIVRKV